MTVLITIANDFYDDLISLILTAVDDAYQQPHLQSCHRSRIWIWIQQADY